MHVCPGTSLRTCNSLGCEDITIIVLHWPSGDGNVVLCMSGT